MAEGGIYSSISLGYWSQAEFDANPDWKLEYGQRVELNDGSGKYKIGDGVKLLNALPWVGGAGTPSLTNTQIFVGNDSNQAVSVPLTLSPTSGSFALSDTGVLTMPNASPITRGLLSNTDFTTFNDKVPASRSVNTNAPLNGGGTLSGNLTLGINQANGSTDGYLSSTDWSNFNSKEPQVTEGTNLQYWRGDKTFQTLDTSVVPENTNLYFTNERVESVVNPLLSLKANLASPTFTGVATFQNIIRLTSASLGTAVAGNVEFLTDKFYGVITTGTSRKEFVLADTPLTSGRIIFTTTNGRAIDSSLLTFNGTTVNFNGAAIAGGAYAVALAVKKISGSDGVANFESSSGILGLGVDTNGGYFQPLTPSRGIWIYNNAGTTSLRVLSGGGINFITPDSTSFIFKNGSTTRVTINAAGNIIFANMPTSPSGLAAGTLWSDAGTIKIV